jgi:hypothetical protein
MAHGQASKAKRRWRWFLVVMVPLLIGAATVGTHLSVDDQGPAAPIGPVRATARAQRVPAVPAGSTTFPLHVEAGRRFLVDAAGQPFLLHGDTAWSLIAQLRQEDVIRYLDDRRSRGFNTILVNLLESAFSSRAPRNIYGDAPFTTPGDYSTPNEAYFQKADWILRRAAERGFLVLLTPSYLGYNGGDQGWYEQMRANGTTKLRNYGRFLGRRYQAFTNILWVQGGDYDPPQRELVDAIANGIRETDPDVLQTSHGGPGTPARDYWGDRAWLAVNNIYTYGDIRGAAQDEYEASAMPFFLIESGYEYEHGASTKDMRRQAYHALLAGAMGQMFGNNPIWHFDGPGLYDTPVTWQQALASPGSRSMTVVRNLYAQLAWWALQPDFAGTFLTAGLGDGDDRAVASVGANRNVAVVYVPSRRAITLDLRRIAGARASLTWFDPASGATSSAAGSPASTAGPLSLTPPASNAEGSSDWVLVVRSA